MLEILFWQFFNISIQFNTRMVTHPSANCGITSVTLRELGFPTWCRYLPISEEIEMLTSAFF